MNNKYTSAQRSKNSKKVWANRTPEERSRIGATFSGGLSPDERSANTKKVWANLTPQQREARAKRSIAARMAKLTPAESSARAKDRFAKFTPEQQSSFIKAGSANLTTEQRRAIGKASAAKVTPEERKRRGEKAGKTRRKRYTGEQLSAFAMVRMTKSTHEERSANQKKIYAQLSPEKRKAFHRPRTEEERIAMGKKRSAAHSRLTPEELMALGEKHRARMTPKDRLRISEHMAKRAPEDRSAIAQKAANTRKAKYSPEQRSAWGKKAAEAVTPEKQRENGKRLREYHADLKAKAARLDALENGSATASEPIGARLRAAREEAGFSREKAVKGLFQLGISITVEAVKKHERDKSRPRPAVQQAYARLFKKPQKDLFGA